MADRPLGHWLALGRLFSDATPRDPAWALQLPNASWRKVAATALRHMVAPELHHRLAEVGLADAPPAPVREALEAAALLNDLVHDDLRAVFADVCTLCNAAGHRPVILKGGIDVLSPTDAVNGSRMIADIDILLDSAAAQDVFDRLIAAGFQRCDFDFAKDPKARLQVHHHLPPLWHPTIAQFVELHDKLGSSQSERWLTAQVRRASLPRQINGLSFLVPDIYARLQHNASHTCIRDMNKGKRLPGFRALLDFHRLARRWQAAETGQSTIDRGCADPAIASALRVSAALSNAVFLSATPHGPLQSSESRIVSTFRRRLHSPVHDRGQATLATIGQLIRRFRNSDRLLAPDFYRVRIGRLWVHLRRQGRG